jgi:uncharacterized protein YecE (DUF72 family)
MRPGLKEESMSDIRIGTSGWSYSEWVGVFYPSEKTNKLSFYSGVFNTVEVDSTFYSYPSRGTVIGWARYTPDGFCFSLKVPRLITHDKRLDVSKGVQADTLRFLELLKPLMERGKLGPLLLQLPPSFTYEEGFGRLKDYLDVFPEDVRLAVEFRHPSWLREEPRSALSDRNVATVIVDEPLLPPETEVTADFALIRWHGRGSRPWYNYRYREGELRPWVPRVKEIAGKTRSTFGYFNNHFRGFAVENSVQMMKMLGIATKRQEEVGERAKRFIESGGRERVGREGSITEYMGDRQAGGEV